MCRPLTPFVPLIFQLGQPRLQWERAISPLAHRCLDARRCGTPDAIVAPAPCAIARGRRVGASVV